MLMHIIQITEDEDDSYDYADSSEMSDAYINIHQVASITPDDTEQDKCFVYMTNEDYFYVNESMDSFIARYNNILYGTVLTKFYDSTNKHN